ncbi:MAG: hypothetical protein QM704_19275 [Anaeromyxobacteraceae bacterium]
MTRWLAVALSLLIAGPAFAGPFGFQPGLTRAQVEAKVGKIEETDNPRVYRTKKAPTPLRGMEGYALLISKQYGLCKVMGIGRDVETSVYGTELESAYGELKQALIKKYGAPSTSAEYLKSGSIWREPKDFMMGLKLQERQLWTAWTVLTDPEVDAISLEAKAIDANTGYLNLSYEFTNFTECVAEKEKVDSDAL